MEHAAPVHAGQGACDFSREIDERERGHRRSGGQWLAALIAQRQDSARTTGQQLRYARQVGNMLQHAHFMPQPGQGVRPEQLLADHGGAARHILRTAHDRAVAAVEHLATQQVVGSH